MIKIQKNFINDWNEENTNDLMKIINNTNHSVGKKIIKVIYLIKTPKMIIILKLRRRII